jgi:hypothetical protein
MNRKETVTLEDILDDLMLQESEPSHEALLRWCNQYPEHRKELASFFATWAVQKEQVEHPAIDEAHVANRMVSHALNLLYRQPASVAAEQTASAESRLHKMIEASGLSEDTLIAKCSLDDTLLAKLDRRLILFASIPRTCIQKLSQALRCAADDVVRALWGDPIPLANYKAKGKPTLKQETFLDAVASSELSDDLKHEWQRVVSTEKPQTE